MAQKVKNLPAMEETRDACSIRESELPPGEGNGYLLQYSCLRNPMDREAWQVIVCGGHKELDRTEHIV